MRIAISLSLSYIKLVKRAPLQVGVWSPQNVVSHELTVTVDLSVHLSRFGISR